MTNEEIQKARSLIYTVGEPQGRYAEEVMKLLRQSLDDLEAANTKVEDLRKKLFVVVYANGRSVRIPKKTVELMEYDKMVLVEWEDSNDLYITAENRQLFERLVGQGKVGPQTIEDLLGECRECNRLVRDCGNHGPDPRADLKPVVEVCQNCLRNIRCDVHPPTFEKRVASGLKCYGHTGEVEYYNHDWNNDTVAKCRRCGKPKD